MMKLRFWNYNTHKYAIKDVPDGNYKTYSENMSEIINCPHCYKELTFGECYTSQEVHTVTVGFGYGVCENCYEKESKRRYDSQLKYRNEEKYDNNS